MRGLNKAALLLAGAVAMSASLTATAGGDAAAGKAKAAVCAACHGVAGIAAIPTYPNLAGQNAAYLVSALNAYKKKERNGGQAMIMQGQAAALSDADIANLAAYFASLK